MRFRLGKFTLDVVSDGRWRLDGGMIFGIVPKVLWERSLPADDKNRIPMALNCLLVRTGRDVILIDTGIGDTWDEKFRQTYAVERPPSLLESLAACDVRPDDVTLVINSHLHFDHAGTNTRFQGDRLVPTFPRARYVVQRGEYEHARQPLERDRASYRPVTWEPLERTGQLELIEGDRELLPGLQVLKVGGHNRDFQCVLLRAGDDTAIFWGDLIPTTHHVPLPWIMALDLYPVQTLEQKKRWIPQAARDGWLCFFYHDTRIPAGRIIEAEGKYRVIPVSGEDHG
jgi:glyoxylase-like metal-dependent hydrolase (beta-lactamase superfamily II)